jgi:ketosteroid isomerase-like protein
MNMMRTAALLAAGIVALAGCQPPANGAGDTAADEAAIKVAGADWDKSYNAGNADSILERYADDAVLMPPGAPAVNGAAAMKEYLKKDMTEAAAGGVVLAIDTSRAALAVSGDFAWRSGTFALRDRNGATLDTGKWLEVWRKADGKWRIVRDIWNTDTRSNAAVSAGAPAATS